MDIAFDSLFVAVDCIGVFNDVLFVIDGVDAANDNGHTLYVFDNDDNTLFVVDDDDDY